MSSSALIHHARLAGGLSQTELARRSGTSQATLSDYERDRKTPGAETLERILLAAGQRLTTTPASRPVYTPSQLVLAHNAAILEQVVGLAELLPGRHSPELHYPRLPSAADDE